MAGIHQPRRAPGPGARVSDIAGRAGVNKQLISYYFGGKEGLYAELARQWQATSTELADPDQPLDAVVSGFAMTSLHDRDWARLMVWANLSSAGSGTGTGPGPGDRTGDGFSDATPDGGQNDEILRMQVTNISRRQAAGELPADLDPALLLLALFAAASAPVTLPAVARAITGADPESPEFVERYADQLGRLVRHLTEDQ